jgi:phosphatidylglycerophosphate synthase
MFDLGCSLALLALTVVAAILYAARVARSGRAKSSRVDREGSSALLGKTPMEATYWAIGPVVRACVALGIGPNAITFASLVLGAAAGAALAIGHFGIAAVASVVASLCDALDGAVARAARVASDSGEVFDAAVDRYVEIFFIGGLAIFYRNDVRLLALALLAVTGAFMVSYSTAKAEALHVTPPRGAMRRAERAVYLTTGAALAPLAGEAATRFALPAWSADVPPCAALFLIALVGNVSAVQRLRAIAIAVAR